MREYTELSFVELSEAEFEGFASTHEQGSYLQSLPMARLLETRGRSVAFIGLKKEGQLVAAALLSSMPLKWGRCFEIAGGPLLEYENEELMPYFFQSLKKYIKSRRGLYLTIAPKVVHRYCDSEGKFLGRGSTTTHQDLLACGFQHHGFSRTYVEGNPRVVYVKNLTDMTKESLSKTYHASTRTKVNKTAKSGLTIRELSRAELPLFEQVMHHTGNRQGFYDNGLGYYEALYDAFDEQAHFVAAEINFQQYGKALQRKIDKLKQTIEECNENDKKARQQANAQQELQAVERRLAEAAVFFTEENQEQLLAVGLFIERPQGMLFLFGGMYEQYKNCLSPSYYLQHVMMQQAIAKGLTRFNFYGIEGIYDGSDGVLNFKKGFEGIVEEQLGTYTFVTKPTEYRVYKRAKKVVGYLRGIAGKVEQQKTV